MLTRRFFNLATVPVLVLQLAQLAQAAPAPTSSSSSSSTINSAEWCSSNSQIVSCFKNNPSATPYCSTYNKISTQTTTTTVTVGGSGKTVSETITVIATPAATSWTTSTETQSVVGPASTITSTTIVTTTVVVTSTTSQPTTCMYTGIRQSPITKRAAATTQSSTTTTNKYCYTSSYPPAGISSACSCLNLPTPTVTTTTTVSNLDVTSTITETTTPTITKTSTITTTTTIPNTSQFTSWKTESQTTTSTTTTWIPAETVKRNYHAFKYRKYTVNSNGDEANVYTPHYDTQRLKALTPDFNGGSKGFLNPFVGSTGGNIEWPGKWQTQNQSTPAANTTVVMQAYFAADGDGDYTFHAHSAPYIDWYYSFGNSSNWVSVWVGDEAYQWQDKTRSFDVSQTTNDPSKWTRGSKTVTLRAGDVIPITIVWAAGTSNAGLFALVTIPFKHPNAQSMEDSDEHNWDWRPFIIRPCDGSPFT